MRIIEKVVTRYTWKKVGAQRVKRNKQNLSAACVVPQRPKLSVAAFAIDTHAHEAYLKVVTYFRTGITLSRMGPISKDTE